MKLENVANKSSVFKIFAIFLVHSQHLFFFDFNMFSHIQQLFFIKFEIFTSFPTHIMWEF